MGLLKHQARPWRPIHCSDGHIRAGLQAGDEIYALRRCNHNPSGCERPFIALHPSGIY
jgi:hypothetical protein